MKHADLTRSRRPNVEFVETITEVEGRTRRDLRWITDRGELHEWWLDGWRKEYPIKTADDYRIMARAWEDVRYEATSEFFDRAEAEVGDRGMTVGHLGWEPLRRLPWMELHVELAGPERLAYDMADGLPELMELHDLLVDVILRKCRAACESPAKYVKLWDNLSLEMIGPKCYRELLVPVYRQILDIFGSAGKRLLVHYDGRLRGVADDIAALDIDGIDSFSGPPEGDMTAAEARARWPEKFLWAHPSLGWYREPPDTLAESIRRLAQDAGPCRYCLMISEEVPSNWESTIPLVLETLDTMADA